METMEMRSWLREVGIQIKILWARNGWESASAREVHSGTTRNRVRNSRDKTEGINGRKARRSKGNE